MATFESSLKPKLIYIFAIQDEWHKDCLKIGETTLEEDTGELLEPNNKLLQKAACRRIDQYTKTAGIPYQLLYTELTIYIKNGKICSFNDKQVHSVLERSGIKKKIFDAVKGANEWFCCDLETAKKAIKAVKNGMTSLNASDISSENTPILFRPEQKEAIEKTIKQFRRSKQMLWNAKMRFGKTLSALEVVKRENFSRTIILTHRPVVDKGWFEDFGKIFYDRKDFHYGSREKGEAFQCLEQLAAKGDKYVYFASMQDMRGSDAVGGKYVKNSEEFNADWDLLIVDEAHEGTQTELGQSVIKELTKSETKILKLSGTPFNLLDDYSDDEIFTWDYVMEQRAKSEWDLTHFGDPNPYESLPAINIYTYDLGTLMNEYIGDEKAFNFREFFRTRDDDTLIHEKDVDRFLNLLCKDDKESLYPYSCDRFRNIFRHTLWVLPGVSAARAVSSKLRCHPVFSNFSIVNVAGNGDEEEESKDALEMVNNAIGQDSEKTYTITLSCGRLTTGVSIKPWTGVFMLSGSFSTSAAQYMQTIFRVQTPYTNHGRMKTQCYAFDFAPDRTLRVLAETAKVSAKAGKATDEDRKILGDFLNFCPIISIEGSQMAPYDVNRMMGQLKKAQIEKVVQCGFEDGALYNDELLKLTDVELSDFNDLKKTIGKTKAMAKTNDIDINRQGFTNEEYKEKERLEKKKKRDLTPEEIARLKELKEKHNQRKDAISILRGISIRMPLLIYGAELNSEEEITIDNFSSIIDDQSWEEFMPKGVDKNKFERFKKYYEPDVFREAGKRIREMARAADKFTIEERIERIASIFNTFRNPDKETVLTPWRVVNMHMSDCLGGYCFYDSDFNQMLHTPRYVDKGKVTADIFRPESHILEINSKSGLYPLYVAYNVYRARIEAAKQKYGDVSHGFAMSLWDATIEENILIVCKTPMAKSITKRTLAGFRNTRVNAQYYKDLIKNISEKPTVVVNTLKDGKHFWKINNEENMKLDAIVGNPPYQIMDGGNGSSSKAIYGKFVQCSKKIRPKYISIIMPSRWMTGGKGLDEFRTEMINDKCIRILHDYMDSSSCFTNVQIEGGVCYFLWEKNSNSKCQIFTHSEDNKITNSLRYLLEDYSDVFIRNTNAVKILNKILKNTEESFSKLVFPRNPFGIFDEDNYIETENISTKLKIFGRFNRERCVKALKNTYEVNKNKTIIDKWKVFISKADGAAGQLGNPIPAKIIGKAELGYPNTICTETFLVIAPFETKEQASNVISYTKTKFFRFMVGTRKLKNMTKDTYSFVPLQNFKDDSDINWSESIAEIDKQLYAKYGLTDGEITFIESMIKPME